MTELSFRRLLLRFALAPILCVCGFLIIVALQLRLISIHRLAGAQATSVLLQSHVLQNTLVDEETGVRGYLASGNRLFLQPYFEGLGRFGGELSGLEALAASDSPLAKSYSSIATTSTQFDEVNRALLKEGLPTTTRLDLLRQQKGRMEDLRSQFAQINADYGRSRELHRAALTTILRSLPAISIASGALLTILLLWYGTRLYREITRAFEQQLGEAEIQRDSLETTLHSIGDGVIVCDETGVIKLLNPTAESLTGWTGREARGRPLPEVFRILHESTRVPVENPFDKVVRLNSVVQLANHTVLIHKDGNEIPIDDSGAPIRNAEGGLSGVVLVFRSVAERRRTTRELRDSQQRLASIYNTSLEYIGILNPQGILLDCNRASLEFAGNTRENLIGQAFWDCPWFSYTEGMPAFVKAAVERAAAGEAMRTEMALVRPSGEVTYFDFSLTPVLDSDGRVLHIVPESRDITELKQAENALLRSEKLAAVGRLAASIAHEINNPLEAITNLLYLAKIGTSLESVHKYVDSAAHELGRVSAIANQTLRFHKQSMKPEPIQPAELVQTVLSIYEGRLRTSGISVEVRHDVRHPIVCFAGDVRQVLSNLIGNAIDAISTGGQLRIRSHIGRDWRTGRAGVIFAVADSGNGIASGDLKKIFEPFFSTKGNEGNGLGLWVSQEIVSRHGGSLRVRSSVRREQSGTVFRLFLREE
jgi:PAS domain S-box-containing protein